MMSLWAKQWWLRLCVLISGLVVLVFFEAGQQYYYITKFELAAYDVSFVEVLLGQLQKWLIWVVVSIPFVWYIWRYLLSNSSSGSRSITHYVFVILLALIVNIMLISGWHLGVNGAGWTVVNLVDSTVFYLFQKGPIYLLAYIGLITLVKQFHQQFELKLTFNKLSELKASNLSLYQKLKAQSVNDDELTINVKIGNKRKPILLNEIDWIEADDYCVKLHTKGHNYTLRTSMKALEQQLPQHQFIRVHRKSIINISSIDEFQLSSTPQIKLKEGAIILIAQSRLKAVRKILNPDMSVATA